MSWRTAVDLALRLHSETGDKYMVRGYLNSCGGWTWAAHSIRVVTL